MYSGSHVRHVSCCTVNLSRSIRFTIKLITMLFRPETLRESIDDDIKSSLLLLESVCVCTTSSQVPFNYCFETLDCVSRLWCHWLFCSSLLAGQQRRSPASWALLWGRRCLSWPRPSSPSSPPPLLLQCWVQGRQQETPPPKVASASGSGGDLLRALEDFTGTLQVRTDTWQPITNKDFPALRCTLCTPDLCEWELAS